MCPPHPPPSDGRRVIASSRASLVSAALGAYCAFTGPLHGGAPGPPLDMLDEAEASGDVTAWAEKKLAAGERLMGFGHRVFRFRRPARHCLTFSSRAVGREPWGDRGPAGLRRGGRARRRRDIRAAETRSAAVAAQCRNQRRLVARCRRPAARRLLAGVRVGAQRRLASARDGAAKGGAVGSPVVGLCRSASRWLVRPRQTLSR